MTLFSVHCTTCRRRLKVTDPAAIGAILACPGCGGMVQIVPPEGWQAGGSGESPASAAVAAKPVGPPPLVRPKIASPELTSEAVEAAVAGAGSVPASPAVTAAEPAGISPKTLWLGAGAGGVAVAAALIAVLIGATSKSPTANPNTTVAETKPADPPNNSAPASPPAAEKIPESKAPSAPPAANPQPAADKPPVDKPIADPPSAEKPSIDKSLTDKPATDKPVEATPAVAPAASDPKVAATEPKSAPSPFDPPAPKPIPIVDNKPDPDEDLDPAERSSSFAVRRGQDAIDWPSRMSQPIAGLECRELPLADFAVLLSDVGNAPIALDVDALVEMGVSPSAPVTVRLGNTTLSSALESGLSSRGLRAVVEGNHLLVTRAADKGTALRSVPYGVADLAPDAAALAGLGDAIRLLIAPDSWKDAGGTGTMRVADGSLVVEQTPAVHYQIVLLCEKLRIARGLPLKSHLDPALFRLDARTDRAKERLNQPIPAAFFRNAPLPKILDYLTKKTKTRLLLDVRALEYDGTTPDATGTIAAQGQLLSAALTSMLEPLHLAYRVVDEQTLQITTPRGFRRELEFYRAADLLASGLRPEQIIERIAKEVAPGRWAIAGGKGSMYFDRASGCLIVSHSQLVQRDVQAFLSNWRQTTVAAKETARK